MPNNAKKKKKRQREIQNNTESLIKDIDITNLITIHDILSEDYPIFCFKYLSKESIGDCNDPSFLIEFLFRLQKLSELGWSKIRTSHKHSFGMEPIPVDAIRKNLPTCVTDDVKFLHVFRAHGDNRPFVGLQIGRIFRIFFIEANFGDIYNHK